MFVLVKMGFGAIRIGWIKRCVMCAKVSVLVNGSEGGKFSISGGLILVN